MYIFVHSKDPYTGTPNSDVRKLCTLLLWEECKQSYKPSAPIEVEGKGCDIIVKQKTS